MAQDHTDCLVGCAKLQKEAIYWIKNNAFNVSEEKRTVTSNNRYANIYHQIGYIPIKYTTPAKNYGRWFIGWEPTYFFVCFV